MQTVERPVLFVGDIHGCAAELETLLAKAGFSPQSRRLIPVGDMFNRGPDSPRVLRLLQQAKAEPILGNHEHSLLYIAQLEKRDQNLPAWALHSHSAYTQFCNAGLWEEVLQAIQGWPLWRQSGHDAFLSKTKAGTKNWLVVHAGIHPVLDLEKTSARFLTTVRHCNAQGCTPTHWPSQHLRAPAGYRAWFYHYRAKPTVVFGHWARRGLVTRPRLRGLDTGCVYGRKLTGLLWPEDRLIQVPAKAVYYPTAKRSLV